MDGGVSKLPTQFSPIISFASFIFYFEDDYQNFYSAEVNKQEALAAIIFGKMYGFNAIQFFMHKNIKIEKMFGGCNSYGMYFRLLELVKLMQMEEMISINWILNMIQLMK